MDGKARALGLLVGAAIVLSVAPGCGGVDSRDSGEREVRSSAEARGDTGQSATDFDLDAFVNDTVIVEGVLTPVFKGRAGAPEQAACQYVGDENSVLLVCGVTAAEDAFYRAVQVEGTLRIVVHEPFPGQQQGAMGERTREFYLEASGITILKGLPLDEVRLKVRRVP